MSPTTAATIRRALQHLADEGNNSKGRCPPSQRAQEIYRRVAIDCEPQKEIARELKVSPSRISHLVSHVRRWLAQSSQSSDDALTQAERRRLELALAKARHEGLYHRALRDYDHQHANPTSTTTRTESKPCGAGFQPAINSPLAHTLAPSHPHTPNPVPADHCQLPTDSEITKVVSTTRPLPPAVQLLKTAQRSATELLRMAERDNAERDPVGNALRGVPGGSQDTTLGATPDEDLFDALKTLLLHFRHRAEKEGRVPKSTNHYQLLENILSAFLGIDQGSGGGFLFLDDSIRHFAKTFLLPTVQAYPPVTEPEQLLTDLLDPRRIGVPPVQNSPHLQPETCNLEPETPSSTANCPLSTTPQPETCNLEPETRPLGPLTSPQLDPPSSPPNSSPTPSPPTPSAPQPKKQKPSPPLPHTLTPSRPRTRPSHPSPELDSLPLGSAFATHLIPADPDISLASFFHPTTRPF